MDDVTLAHKPRLLDVATQLKRSAHAALGLAVNCAVIPVAGNGRTGLLFRRWGRTLRSMTALFVIVLQTGY